MIGFVWKVDWRHKTRDREISKSELITVVAVEIDKQHDGKLVTAVMNPIMNGVRSENCIVRQFYRVHLHKPQRCSLLHTRLYGTA